MLFFLFAFAKANAQVVADTSYFVKYASYLTDITPGNFTGIFKQLSDSLVNFIPTPQHDYSNCVAYYRYQSQVNAKDTFSNCTQMHWDKQLRLVRLKSGARFSDPTFDFKAYYSTGMKPLFFILNNSEKGLVIDTAAYHYGNNGMVTSVTYHHTGEKEDSTYTETRLYDNMNRLIVEQNALYGNISGVFTYEYNTKNQVVSRRFMLSSGSAILATDTLIYGMADSANFISSVVHKLKIGNGEWMKMDELHSGNDGKPVMYQLFFDGNSPCRFGISRNMQIDIKYDPSGGKRTIELRQNLLSGETQEAHYYYVTDEDSVCYTRYNMKARSSVPVLEKAEYRKYRTGTTLIDSKTTVTYTSYYRRKKYNYTKAIVETVNYKWSN